MSKFCPNCGRQFEWYEAECPDCKAVLVETPPAGAPNPDGTIISIFETDEPGLLALVKLTLEQRGIEFIERVRAEEPFIAGGEVMRGEQPEAVVEILVARDLAPEVRSLIDDLGSNTSVPVHAASPTADGPPPAADAAVELIDLDTNMPIGHVTTSQFEWLTAHLEEESPEDQDYYIDASTLDMLQDLGGDPALMLLHRTALGSREGIEIGAR